jgi:hypothetical protein
MIQSEASSMGRIFGIAGTVLALWASAELYLKGVEGAFGGVLASGQAEAEAVNGRTLPRRAGDAAERAMLQNEERRQKLLGD